MSAPPRVRAIGEGAVCWRSPWSFAGEGGTGDDWSSLHSSPSPSLSLSPSSLAPLAPLAAICGDESATAIPFPRLSPEGSAGREMPTMLARLAPRLTAPCASAPPPLPLPLPLPPPPPPPPPPPLQVSARERSCKDPLGNVAVVKKLNEARVPLPLSLPLLPRNSSAPGSFK